MSERKNLLFMISSLYGGGSERVCCLLASAMAQKHNVTIVYYSEKEEHYPIDERCRLVRIPSSDRRWKLPFSSRLRAIRFLRRLKREEKIDVTVSFLLQLNALNVLTRCGDRIITSERANPKKYQSDLFWITRLSYALSDYVVFQSEQIRSFYGPTVRRHSGVIPNPVSVSCTAAGTRSHRIVAVGRLAEQKNHKMLIRSFRAFSRRFPEYTLSIYGEGDQRGPLSALIDELGLVGRVILEGNCTDVHQRIADAEMFVLSSDFEGLSNALLECMTMGIACISTACEGSSDVIRNGVNGLLVEIGDEPGLTDAMISLAEDPDLCRRLAKQAKEDAAAFAVNHVIRQWEAVLFDHPETSGG